jgi:hypothetical protein
MSSFELRLDAMTSPTTAAPTITATTPPATRGRVDYAVVAATWAVVVIAAAVFPLDHPHVARVALFIHLVSMAVGFGAVIVIDVYGILWLLGQRTLAELVDLDTAAHTVIAIGVGGLLASGIALQPDLGTPLAWFKMLLVLALMLNGLAAQRMLVRLRKTLPPTTRGASIPWAAFQRGLTAAMVSQASWWGAIAIGFITNANRHS